MFIDDVIARRQHPCLAPFEEVLQPLPLLIAVPFGTLLHRSMEREAILFQSPLAKSEDFINHFWPHSFRNCSLANPLSVDCQGLRKLEILLVL